MGSEEWTHDKVCGRILEKGAKRQGIRKTCAGTSRAEGIGTDNFYVVKDSDSESLTLFFEVRQSLFTFMEQGSLTHNFIFLQRTRESSIKTGGSA